MEKTALNQAIEPGDLYPEEHSHPFGKEKGLSALPGADLHPAALHSSSIRETATPCTLVLASMEAP